MTDLRVGWVRSWINRGGRLIQLSGVVEAHYLENRNPNRQHLEEISRERL